MDENDPSGTVSRCILSWPSKIYMEQDEDLNHFQDNIKLYNDEGGGWPLGHKFDMLVNESYHDY